VGFIHGVMNTDNMTISGETIDYGPCAFMDVYDPKTVFSSIDHAGRYAYGNQPQVAHWNLARLAETLLPLMADDQDTAVERATAVLSSFPDRFSTYWDAGMREKLGLDGDPGALANDLLELMHAQGVDWTEGFRALPAAARGDRGPARALFVDRAAFDAWADRWEQEMPADEAEREIRAAAMERVNPAYIPRNHLVEEALAAAVEGDMDPFAKLVEVVAAPFDERPGLERYAAPPPMDFGATYRTFCGT